MPARGGPAHARETDTVSCLQACQRLLAIIRWRREAIRHLSRRHEELVADPRQQERWRRARRIMLAPQEDAAARRTRGPKCQRPLSPRRARLSARCGHSSPAGTSRAGACCPTMKIATRASAAHDVTVQRSTGGVMAPSAGPAMPSRGSPRIGWPHCRSSRSPRPKWKRKSTPRVRKGGPPVHVVADTNTVVSRLLWHGPPRQVLDAARTGTIALSTSASLRAELAEVLQRPKFAQRLARANVPPHTLIVGYAALARLVVPAPIGPVVEADPDDDAVLACAVAARAEVVVSGDRV